MMFGSQQIISVAMLRNETAPTRVVPNGDEHHIKQVAALLTNLSSIAEKEFSANARSDKPFDNNQEKPHLLIDSQASTPIMMSASSLGSYIQGCRLKKIKQRARAISIERASADLSYISPKKPMQTVSFSPESACVTPIPSPLLGARSKGSNDFDDDEGEDVEIVILNKRAERSPSLPRVIHLSPKLNSVSCVEPRAIDFGSSSTYDSLDATNHTHNISLTDSSADVSRSKKRKLSKLKPSSKASKKARRKARSNVTTSSGQKTLIMKRFCWRDFPEVSISTAIQIVLVVSSDYTSTVSCDSHLYKDSPSILLPPQLENILISSRREYLSFSSRNYTPEQKRFNNSLTAQIIETAGDCGYEFDPQHFNFSAVRDRIRCFYKSYVQGEKKKLFAALSTATSLAEIQNIKAEIAFLETRSSGTKGKK